MLISIFASIGCQNLGDELILKNEIKLLEEKYGANTQFIVFSYDQENPFFEAENVDYVEYFPIGIRNPKNILRNLGNFINFLTIVFKSDLIVVGGGGILYDHEIQHVNNPLNQWAFRSFIFKLFKKRVLFNAIGLNIKSEEFYPKLNDILLLPKAEVTVRDAYSKNLLKKIYIKSKQVLDPVFYDNGNTQKVFENDLLLTTLKAKTFSLGKFKDIDFTGKKVGLALRMGFIKDEEKNITKLIEYIIKSGGTPVLVPHSFHKTDILANDFRFLRGFAFKHDIKIVTSMEEAYKMYTKRKMDMCIAMRLHSIILSQVYNIPYVALSYSKKTDQILKSIDNSK